MTLDVVLVLWVAGFFAAMGLYALRWPARVVALFGTPSLTADGRNEVRAVYGGFGLAVTAALVAALRAPDWGPGVFLAVALALLGMAFGRLVSRLFDGPAGPYPWLFFGIELALAAALLFAFSARTA